MARKSKYLEMIMAIVRVLSFQEREFLNIYACTTNSKKKALLIKELVTAPNQFINSIESIKSKSYRTELLKSVLHFIIEALSTYYRINSIPGRIIGATNMYYHLSKVLPTYRVELLQLVKQVFPEYDNQYTWKLSFPTFRIEKFTFDALLESTGTNEKALKRKIRLLEQAYMDIKGTIKLNLLEKALREYHETILTTNLVNGLQNLTRNIDQYTQLLLISPPNDALSALSINWYSTLCSLYTASMRLHITSLLQRLIEPIYCVTFDNSDTVKRFFYYYRFVLPAIIIQMSIMLPFSSILGIDWEKQTKLFRLTKYWLSFIRDLIHSNRFAGRIGIKLSLAFMSHNLNVWSFISNLRYKTRIEMDTTSTLENGPLVYVIYKQISNMLLNFSERTTYKEITDDLRDIIILKSECKYLRAIYYLWRFVLTYETGNYPALYDIGHAGYQWSLRTKSSTESLFAWCRKWGMKLSPYAGNEQWLKAFRELLNIYVKTPHCFVLERFVPLSHWIASKIPHELVEKSIDFEKISLEIEEAAQRQFPSSFLDNSRTRRSFISWVNKFVEELTTIAHKNSQLKR